ncbi:uncharacterized protein PFL1_06397 [Pseudozyma flocculosa PF-1]|uniref:FAD-binding domain-containing protein n=2 Tax=Pseudozyma flocculosa TaxID=84751 RepID=A0A5C3ETS6_9BASI|nr:uncharacterized protein PFL1_06397 [Pseudozyma flocculosa PF-1]EPQ25942.1 hypothetical protein PFL1_06397 [Pseudozyma flocculosa PF-1]SPO35763.1 uncharacterized protein PSFLO_01234 [Pseudozyma flocculosa]
MRALPFGILWDPAWAPDDSMMAGAAAAFIIFAAASLAYVLFFDRLIWQPLRLRVRASVGEFPHVNMLGTKRAGPKIKGTCVVAGGSLAGLLTARVAMDHFDKVVVVEPDSQLEERRGRVIQWPQAHYFGNAFYQAVAGLFTDAFDEEADKEGIFLHDPGLGRFVFGDRSLPSVETGCLVFGAQRMAMERFLRRCFDRTCSGRDDVEFVKGSVTGLVPSHDGQRVDAVKVQKDEGESYMLPASFVIDCTGPASCGVKWLTAPLEEPLRSPGVEGDEERRHAWTAPPRWRYHPTLTYYSALVQVAPEDLESLPKPPHCQDKGWDEIGILLAQVPSLLASDHLQLVLLFHGQKGLFTFLHGDRQEKLRPTKVSDFRRASDELDFGVLGSQPPAWQDELMDALEQLEEQGKIEIEYKEYRNTATTYNRYVEVADSLPANFIALGDSVSNTNPRFAQGTRKIITELGTLNAMLHDLDWAAQPRSLKDVAGSNNDDDAKEALVSPPEIPGDFCRRYFDDVHGRDVNVWQFCQAEDYASDTTQTLDAGDSRRSGWFERWYRLALGRVAAKDKAVARLVVGLLSSDTRISPIDPLHPLLFLRTMWHMPAVVMRYKLGLRVNAGGRAARRRRQDGAPLLSGVDKSSSLN